MNLETFASADVPAREGEKRMSFELRAAFRETFLVEMPGRDKEIYRLFGRMLWDNGVTENDDIQMPIKRCGLRAVLHDLEHIEEFILTSLSGVTNERGESRLTEAAYLCREQLLCIIDDVRKALGMKRYGARFREG